MGRKGYRVGPLRCALRRRTERVRSRRILRSRPQFPASEHHENHPQPRADHRIRRYDRRQSAQPFARRLRRTAPGRHCAAGRSCRGRNSDRDGHSRPGCGAGGDAIGRLRRAPGRRSAREHVGSRSRSQHRRLLQRVRSGAARGCQAGCLRQFQPCRRISPPRACARCGYLAEARYPLRLEQGVRRSAGPDVCGQARYAGRLPPHRHVSHSGPAVGTTTTADLGDHRDMAQLVRCCIDHDDYHFLVAYGVSNNRRSRWSNDRIDFPDTGRRTIRRNSRKRSWRWASSKTPSLRRSMEASTVRSSSTATSIASIDEASPGCHRGMRALAWLCGREAGYMKNSASLIQPLAA